MLYTPLLIIFAAICNSSMDIVKDAWSHSIFNTLRPGTFWFFWFAEDSNLNKYNHRNSSFGRVVWFTIKIGSFEREITKPVQITDNWHFAKSLMIISFCFAILLYEPIAKYQFMKSGDYNWNWILDMIVFALCWNLPFNLFYNKVFRLKAFRV